MTSSHTSRAFAGALFIAISGAALGQTTPPVNPQKASPESTMKALRLQVLNSSAASLGQEPSKEYPHVYGVVMDWPVGTNTATVVSMSSGDASLYTTSGFGIIGGIGHERVRNAASAFIKGAERHVDASKPVTSYPHPPTDRVHFYLLTFDGVRLVQADRASVEARSGPMFELFELGQAVLTELREISEKQP